MLTQVLAIPLANHLPTPNARKTCALAVWLIQTQRLPAEVLEPARDRISYALRRGIDGELGKEGKKGSQTDGLKVRTSIALPHTCAEQAYRLSTTSPYTFPQFSFLLFRPSSAPSSPAYSLRHSPSATKHATPLVDLRLPPLPFLLARPILACLLP